jgi:hypothetical protein
MRVGINDTRRCESVLQEYAHIYFYIAATVASTNKGTYIFTNACSGRVADDDALTR